MFTAKLRIFRFRRIYVRCWFVVKRIGIVERVMLSFASRSFCVLGNRTDITWIQLTRSFLFECIILYKSVFFLCCAGLINVELCLRY